MTSKILVPYDVSQYSNDAFQNALEIAKKFDAKSSLLHVTYLPESGITGRCISNFLISLRFLQVFLAS